ncbi:MAG: ECF transporter S component [Thermoproteales archaeon]|nr:ECF transporter S component [Thermoproteales archaeon]RLE63519.1 MAG: hypothetical protein DRJ47_09315 [Thermoprotei archaeon]
MEKTRKSSQWVVLTALNAALYATFIMFTAYITTPFFIQFRPAVVVPAIFAAVYGPWVGGVGAALGTFIASIIRYGTPLLTIFSGTPGNFFGFFIVGYFTQKYKKEGRWLIGYIIGSIIGILVGFAIIAIGLIFLATALGFTQLSSWTNPYFVASSMTFGIISELPFMLILGPPVIQALEKFYRGNV